MIVRALVGDSTMTNFVVPAGDCVLAIIKSVNIGLQSPTFGNKDTWGKRKFCDALYLEGIMKKIKELSARNLEFVFTDIDDTLTNSGKLGPEAFTALWQLQRAGFKVIIVTGRPAGWCDAIARQWPVEAVVGENGGFYFFEDGQKLHRVYTQPLGEREANTLKRDQLWQALQKKFPLARKAADQFARQLDLAIDVSEDEPHLPEDQVQDIMAHLREAGATVKLSSIHINAWFGNFDKAKTCLAYLKDRHQISPEQALEKSVYCGDSPNDEPLFKLFPHSVGVRNIEKFVLDHPPRYITEGEGGLGFVELAEVLLKNPPPDS